MRANSFHFLYSGVLDSPYPFILLAKILLQRFEAPEYSLARHTVSVLWLLPEHEKPFADKALPTLSNIT